MAILKYGAKCNSDRRPLRALVAGRQLRMLVLCVNAREQATGGCMRQLTLLAVPKAPCPTAESCAECTTWVRVLSTRIREGLHEQARGRCWGMSWVSNACTVVGASCTYSTCHNNSRVPDAAYI